MEKALTAGKSSFIAGFGWGGGGSSGSHPPGGSGPGVGGGGGSKDGSSYSLSSWFGSLSTSKTKANAGRGKLEVPGMDHGAEGTGGKKWTRSKLGLGGHHPDEGEALDLDDAEDERLIKLIQVSR